MSLWCLRWVLSQAARGVCSAPLHSSGPAVALRLPCRPSALRPAWGYAGASAGWWSPLSTTADSGGGDGETEAQKMKQKQDPRARATIGSVGRKIHQRHLQVLGETGEDLGTMHRADVLRLMDQKGLKLVPVNERRDPPLYRLMSGKQIHEEQVKLREKQKAKAGPIQVKELTLSSDIAPHDLDTKLRQVQSWLDRKNHVRLTLRTGSANSSHTQPLDMALEQMVERMGVTVGFVSKPRIVREGRAAMCILRPPSAKELRQQGAPQRAQTPPSDSSSSPDPDTNTPPSTSPTHQPKDSQPQ